MQLSHNRVHVDYVYDTMDVFPVFQVSLEIDGYLPAMSQVTPPVSGELPTSLATLGSDSLPPGATGSLDSLIGGPVKAWTKPTGDPKGPEKPDPKPRLAR